MIHVIDTNIISYLLKKDVQVRNRMLDAIEQNYEFAMLPIVYYEITRWLLERKAIQLQNDFNQMCMEMPLAEANKAVWDQAAALYVQARQMGKPIGSDADIIIAAFFLVYDYSLITNNVRHFERIDGLRIINWKSDT
ncbi:MAG: PIN domain-containing protein [Oscillospiraceae bacterium]|jgi:tRNA(fMet)-specific endonuclease VapC|nr:PIN domain-containing protein [Oscillospiraceae bacterium]